MCEICRQNSCHPRCPNAETESIFCKNCGGLITEYDEPYMDEFEDRFCSLDCALDYHNIRKE